MVEIRSRKEIEFLVDEFYKEVLRDKLIGIYFSEIVQLNWEVHIPIMYDFWETALLDGVKYRGNPMLKHIQLDARKTIRTEHIDRWLSIWEDTVRKNFGGRIAEQAIEKANGIGELMRLKLNQYDGLRKWN